MTTTLSTSTPVEAASFLAPDDVPVKLRCAICSNLAVNAFRLPCCDQNICENCQSRLPPQCPVCEHSPLSAEDCKPNKSLRTTIKVFLRTEEKKREQARERQRQDVPAAPPDSVEAPQQDASGNEAVLESMPSVKPPINGLAAADKIDAQRPDAPDAPLQDDNASGGQPPKSNAEAAQALHREHSHSAMDATKGESTGSNENPGGMQNMVGEMNGGQLQGPSGPSGMGSGLEGNVDSNQTMNQMGPFSQGMYGNDSMQSGYPNMGWNMQGDYNPMYQNIQNGMPNEQWGMMPNMMGMPDFNGDPMAMSQGMYGNFNGQGTMDMTGMNGMNGMDPMNMNMQMNMGMGMGMGMDVGPSGYDGWSNQGPWNANQESFMPHMGGGHPGMNGMGSGFGADASTGYHPHPHPHHPAAATPAGYNNIQSAHPNFGSLPHDRQFRPNHNPQNGFQGGSGRGLFPMGSRAGRGGRGFGHHQGGRGRGSGRGHGGDSGPFRHQLPQRPPHMMADTNRYGPGPRDGYGKPALDTGTDAKAVAGLDLWPEPNDHPGTATNTGLTTQTSDQQQKVETSIADQALHAGASNTSTGDVLETHQRAVNGIVQNGEPDMSNTAMGEDDGKDFQHGPPDFHASTASHDLPHELAGPSPITKTSLDPAMLNHGEQPQGDFIGRGRGASGRGPYRGVNGRGGRGALGVGMHGFGVGPPPGPAPTWSNQPDVPAAVPPEPKGQGVEGAPKAPKALREGLPNTGISGRGFTIIGRGGVTTGAGRSGPRRSRSRSPERDRSRSRGGSPTRLDERNGRRSRSRSRSPELNEDDYRREHRHHDSRRRESDTVDPDDAEDRDPRSRASSLDRSRSHSRSPTKDEHARTRPEKEPRSSRRSRRPRRSRRDRSRERRRRRRASRARSRSPVQDSAPRDPRYNSPHDDRRRSRERAGLAREDSKRWRHDPSTAKDERRELRRSGHRSEDIPRGVAERGRDSRGGGGRERVPPTEPAADLHMREREARNRERLAKEQQRREELQRQHRGNDSDRKREREPEDAVDGDVRGGGAGDGEGRNKRKRTRHRRRRTIEGEGGGETGRRVNYKYEDDVRDEARARRIEQEREAARWR